MNKEFIEREAAIFAEEAAFDGDGFSRNHAVAAIKGVTAADVAPVVRGRWRKKHTPYTDHAFICSACNKEIGLLGDLPHYCPNCGARMGVNDAAD